VSFAASPSVVVPAESSVGDNLFVFLLLHSDDCRVNPCPLEFMAFPLASLPVVESLTLPSSMTPSKSSTVLPADDELFAPKLKPFLKGLFPKSELAINLSMWDVMSFSYCEKCFDEICVLKLINGDGKGKVVNRSIANDG